MTGPYVQPLARLSRPRVRLVAPLDLLSDSPAALIAAGPVLWFAAVVAGVLVRALT